MKIVALEPYALDILTSFGAGLNIVGSAHQVETPPNGAHVMLLTNEQHQESPYSESDARRLVQGITSKSLDLNKLKRVEPDIIFAAIRELDSVGFITWAQDYLRRELGREVKIKDISVNSLEAVYQVIQELGAFAGNRTEARKLASHIKAQLMYWADSFFDRCRGKQVVVLSQVDPISIEGRWFTDLIRMFGGKALDQMLERKHLGLTWSDVVAARADVIIVAPENGTINQSVELLPLLQALPGWDDLPAVKRGEVIFAPGVDLYRPGPRFLKGAAIVASAMAGLDSGYITDRDEYFRVRYLELHRHRFL